MANGIRIAQAGVPVTEAADYQMTMDERWPLVDYMFADVLDLVLPTDTPGTITNNTDTIAWVPLYEHNLGFLPGFRILEIYRENINTNTTRLMDDLYADERYIYAEVRKTAGVKTIRAKFWLGVMSRNLNTTYAAPIPNQPASQSSSASIYGVRILKDFIGGNINTRKKIVYSLNTNAKSLAIQMHGVHNVTDAAGNVIVLQHNLGYPPSYFFAYMGVPVGFGQPMKKTVVSPLGSLVGIASSTATTLTIRGVQSVLWGDYMYLVIKDPVDVAK